MKFKDKPYKEKRSILRKYYMDNPDAHKIVKKLAFNVKKKLKSPILDVMDYETIIEFLIDGYKVFQICPIINEIIELDPLTLQCELDGLDIVWINNKNTPYENKIDKNNIIYITYDSSEISFLCSVYEGLIKLEDEQFILDHVDFIVDKLSNKKLKLNEILNIDKILLRNFKIKRLKNNII